MWQEVVIEKPARRGLALAIMAVLMAATTSFAWVMSINRATPVLSTEPLSPYGWPFAFTLPDSFSWVSESPSDVYDPSQEGNLGSVGFLGRNSLRGKAVLIICFAMLPENTTPNEATQELLGSMLLDPRPITIGSLEGLMIRQTIPLVGRSSSMEYSAIGCHPSGLTIAVKYVVATSSEKADHEFKEFCQKIVFKPWWISP